MKRSIMAVALAAVMVFALAACGGSSSSKSSSASSEASSASSTSSASSESSTKSDPAESKEASSEETELLGGWEINTELVSKISDDQQAIFDKAMESFVGQTFTPVALLGTQVVSGTNYMFLCQGTLVTASPVTDYKVVTVYADLEGNAEITSVVDFDYTQYIDAETAMPLDEQLAGGWEVNKTFEVTNELDENVQKAFDAVSEGESEAIELLGSQVVSGTNYAVLATSDSGISIFYIYAPLDGDAEVMNVYYLNLADYTGEE